MMMMLMMMGMMMTITIVIPNPKSLYYVLAWLHTHRFSKVVMMLILVPDIKVAEEYKI